MERCPPVALSWLRLDVLPSMATKSGRSGQVSRAQPANAAWNKAGSIRFINMVSQRPPGTPLAKGRWRRGNSRCASPQAAMSS